MAIDDRAGAAPEPADRAERRAAARGADLPQLRWLSTADIAARTGQGHRTIQRWIAEGRLPAIRPGGRNYRVLESDLNAFIDGSRVTVGGAA